MASELTTALMCLGAALTIKSGVSIEIPTQKPPCHQEWSVEFIEGRVFTTRIDIICPDDQDGRETGARKSNAGAQPTRSPTDAEEASALGSHGLRPTLSTLAQGVTCATATEAGGRYVTWPAVLKG